MEKLSETNIYIYHFFFVCPEGPFGNSFGPSLFWFNKWKYAYGIYILIKLNAQCTCTRTKYRWPLNIEHIIMKQNIFFLWHFHSEAPTVLFYFFSISSIPHIWTERVIKMVNFISFERNFSHRSMIDIHIHLVFVGRTHIYWNRHKNVH